MEKFSLSNLLCIIDEIELRELIPMCEKRNCVCKNCGAKIKKNKPCCCENDKHRLTSE